MVVAAMVRINRGLNVLLLEETLKGSIAVDKIVCYIRAECTCYGEEE
jgi:hypothetical protein